MSAEHWHTIINYPTLRRDSMSSELALVFSPKEMVLAEQAEDC
jgi:hypothetical protein